MVCFNYFNPADPEGEAAAAEDHFDRVFRRKWRYYLASCEAAFRERVIGDLQLVLTRAGNRGLKSEGF